MVVEESSQEQVEPKEKVGKFRKSPILARRTFIIGITAILFTGILMVLSAYGPIGFIPIIILLCLTFVLSIVGAVFGVLSFREGMNVFSIIGFILILILVAALPYGIYQTIRLYVLL
ncbi:MAG: hypothetical protein KGD59_11535 [Candidatus Heimdallarchaeota archaeon]|nr:hypothetical protein [Candidatus Heimdallarchaeota archaeon]MBY8995175.1 hypothetical protein [Candidatus Heimdallarchaeota archaeon]